MVSYLGLSITTLPAHNADYTRYDTGTIGGVIAMEDWLETFGSFEAGLPASQGVNGFFIPTNRKSLVVSLTPLTVPVVFIRVVTRSLFSLPELSLARFSHFQWETWLVVNGEL